VRLTARGRALVLLTSVTFLVLALLASGRFAALAGDTPDGRPATAVVVVQPGETLWQIARTIDPGADPRALVSSIRELNGLGAEPVVPGQSLVVPR
jgi:nucleoid-associated protein YgaU